MDQRTTAIAIALVVLLNGAERRKASQQHQQALPWYYSMGQAGLNLALDGRARASPRGPRETRTGKTNALALAAGLDVVLGAAGHDSHAGTARVLRNSGLGIAS